jgi:hypothetical protein
MESCKKQSSIGFFVNSNLYWEKALRHFHNNHFQLVFPVKGNVNSDYLYNDQSNNDLFLEFSKDIKMLENMTIHFNKLDKRGDPLPKELILVEIKHSILSLLQQLESWGYLENIIFEEPFGLGPCSTFKITDKGIEVALRLQEHTDNERRYATTALFSQRAFWVSVGALSAAIISAFLSYQRLDLYEKEVNKIESQQAAIVSDIKEIKNQ